MARFALLARRFVFFMHGRPRRAALFPKKVAPMIAPRKSQEARKRSQPAARWHQAFLKMLPAIQKHARIAFRYLGREARDEAVQEVVAGALAAYVRLVESGRADLAYPTPLSMFAVRQFRTGRRVGTKANVNDVTSPYAQAAKGIRVERLDHYDAEGDAWREILIEDRRAGPAQTAAARIDFAQWLNGLAPQRRRIAEVLATGQSTKQAARQFRVSPGRISQIRRELKDSWERFQGDVPTRPSAA